MDFQSEIDKAIAILNKDGVILCPTDTIWGLSADALNEEAVQDVFEIKERPSNKSMIVLVSSLAMLSEYVEEIPEKAIDIISNSRQATSIIYPSSKGLARNVSAENGSIAIRIVKDPFCQQLIETFGRPIISTSANISGNPSPKMYTEIDKKIFSRVDYSISHPEKEKESGKASCIYLIDGDIVQQLR